MPIRFHITTMGCPKNIVDSEGMTLLLEQAGHQEAPEQQADIVIVNTCGFLDAAKQESLAEINDVLRRKRPRQALIAAGCLVQRDEQTLLTSVPGLDAVLGTRRWDEITSIVAEVAGKRGLDRDGARFLLCTGQSGPAPI